MSRALDKATVAALRSGDPEAAFQAIANVLTYTPASSSSARLELELLGRECLPLPASSSYYLRDGNAVAFSKLALVLAFVAARQRLQDVDNVTTENETLRATAVMLMMDPEHLTAANTRKRILQARLSQDKDKQHATAIAGELWLIDSMLTGHLHRHTKSPTLWNHRRWLLALGGSMLQDDLLRHITDVVMVAAARHPRNYYAWDHAQWLVRAAEGGDTSPDRRALALAVRAWCYRNHTDTSGWSFLVFLLILPHGVSPLLAETVAEVEKMATSLHWMGEAVWVFLRTAVAHLSIHSSSSEAVPSIYAQFQQTAAVLQQNTAATSREHRVLQQAQDWCAAAIR